MVLEAQSGGWGKTARQALDVVAKSAAASSSDHAEVSSLRIAQRLSTALHRENVRAILKRLCQPEPAEDGHELFVDEPVLW